MDFSHHNYERYALDFLEGKLSPEDEEEFRIFLNSNPDIKQSVFSGMELSLQPGKSIYPNKKFLKRTTADLIQCIPMPDLECISFLEEKVHQDNSIENILSSFKDSSSRELLPLYKKTILKPGNEIFPGKSNLKKPIPVSKQFYWWGSVAAILLLSLMIKVLFVSGPVQENLSENSGNIILVPAQNTRPKIPVPANLVSEQTAILSNSKTVGNQSDVSIIRPLAEKYKTPQLLDDFQTLPSKVFQEEEIYTQLVSLSLPLSEISFLEKQLKPPVIYIPRVLTQQDLQAFEDYTIEDFHVKLLPVDLLTKSTGKQFISAVKSTLELVSVLTGGNLEINTSYNNSGRLTALDLTSEHIKFSTDRKPD